MILASLTGSTHGRAEPGRAEPGRAEPVAAGCRIRRSRRLAVLGYCPSRRSLASFPSDDPGTR